MILISRSLARRFRAVVRRAGLNKAGQPGSGCVRLLATADLLRLQATNGRVVIEFRSTGQFDPEDLTVPFELFTDCEAKNDSPVMICSNDSGGIVASWSDRGVPQQHQYAALEAVEMPAMAQELTSNPPRLLVALRDAAATVENGGARYSLDCIQLSGSSGRIVATDTHQLLVQGGFDFPWQEDLLMRVSSIFASRELPMDQPVAIGRTEHGITVRVGDWTIHHDIYTEGRFPKWDQIVPCQEAIQTRIQLHVDDVHFLAETVERLPADDQTDRPLTLDLNGSVVVRARKDEQSPLMELLLSRSQRLGPQLRLQTNRAYLIRALELGFTEIGFVNAESPCLCRDASRTYVWMLLESKSALESNPEALCIDSLSMPTTSTSVGLATVPRAAKSKGTDVGTATSTDAVPATAAPVNRVRRHLPSRTSENAAMKADGRPNSAEAQPDDLIDQATTLRNQLRTVTQGLTLLIGEFRRQRKQSRFVKSTLQSLKQLQLLEA